MGPKIGCGAIRDATTYRRIRVQAPHPELFIFGKQRFRKTGAGLEKERTAAQTLRPEAVRFALRECGGSGSEDISGDRPPNVPAALCSGWERWFSGKEGRPGGRPSDKPERPRRCRTTNATYYCTPSPRYGSKHPYARIGPLRTAGGRTNAREYCMNGKSTKVGTSYCEAIRGLLVRCLRPPDPEDAIRSCTRSHKKARSAGAAPLTGLPNLQMVAVLAPVHAACTGMQGQNTGFRQILHHLKNLLYRYNSRKFVSGIKVCPNL